MLGLLVVLVISYLVGAFPSAVVYGRVFRGTDVRSAGSGNAGGTNAWRVLGWKIGVPVMVTDVAKGAVASLLIVRIPLGPFPVDLPTAAVLCGLAAVLGHVFPIYTGFRGGKGVAAAAGMLVVTAPLPAACALGVFGLMVFLTGKVSLGSVSAAVSLPVSVLLIDAFTPIDYPAVLIALSLLLAAFILFTHRSNLRRLIRGEEASFPRLQLWKKLLRPRP